MSWPKAILDRVAFFSRKADRRRRDRDGSQARSVLGLSAEDDDYATRYLAGELLQHLAAPLSVAAQPPYIRCSPRIFIGAQRLRKPYQGRGFWFERLLFASKSVMKPGMENLFVLGDDVPKGAVPDHDAARRTVRP